MSLFNLSARGERTFHSLTVPPQEPPLANKYFEPGAKRAAKVNALFGAIAPRYDLINDLQSLWLHRRWKRRLVAMAGVGPGRRALDLCCGTGDVVFRLARTGAAVIGLDFNEAMLQVARQRAELQHSKVGLGSNLRFMTGDALNVPFSDNQFDAVTVAYGLRNLSDWKAGLAEMWRVAKPGGRLLVLDFGRPDNALWRWLFFAYLRWLVPVFGKIFCGDPALYGYIIESLRHYPAQHGVAAQMRQLGCAEVRVIGFLGGMMTINHGVKVLGPAVTLPMNRFARVPPSGGLGGMDGEPGPPEGGTLAGFKGSKREIPFGGSLSPNVPQAQ